jgi:hypothetical protein
MLSKSKSLCPAKLGPVLAEASHLSLACVCMLFGVHLNVILGEASTSVLGEEGTVSTIQNVHLGVGKLRVVFRIRRAIVLPDMTSHDGCSMCRILAMKD